MRDACGGTPTLDNVGGLEKLLNLILGERLIVSSRRVPRKTQRNDDASENDRKEYHQASGKFSHRESLRKLPVLYPSGPAETTFCLRRQATYIALRLVEILLYTFLLRHYPRSVCSVP